MTADLKARVVAGTAIFRGERILLLRRSLHRSNPGIWDLPGGHVEARESIPHAARREAFEETGFRVRLGPVFHVEAFRSATKRGRTRPTVGVFYHCAAPVRKGPQLDGDEHTEYAWVAFEDLASHPTIPVLERAVSRAFLTRFGRTVGGGAIDLGQPSTFDLSLPA